MSQSFCSAYEMIKCELYSVNSALENLPDVHQNVGYCTKIVPYINQDRPFVLLP